MIVRNPVRVVLPALLLMAGIPAHAADSPATPPVVAPATTPATPPASATAAPLGGTRLQYNLKAGDVFNYKITMQMTGKVHAAAGGQDIPIVGLMQMNQKRAVRKILPNSYEVETTISDMKVSFNGQDIPPVKSIPPITVVMSRRGKVQEVRGLEALANGVNVPGMDSTTFTSIMRDMTAFPDKLLKPGDVWTDNTPMPAAGGKTVTVSSTNKLISLADGKARITQDMTIPLDLTVAQPVPLTMKGRQHGTFDSVYSQASGMPEETQGDMDMDVAMSAPGLTGAAQAAADMNLTMTLKLNSKLIPALEKPSN